MTCAVPAQPHNPRKCGAAGTVQPGASATSATCDSLPAESKHAGVQPGHCTYDMLHAARFAAAKLPWHSIITAGAPAYRCHMVFGHRGRPGLRMPWTEAPLAAAVAKANHLHQVARWLERQPLGSFGQRRDMP